MRPRAGLSHPAGAAVRVRRGRVAFLNLAEQDGVRIDLVNMMAMDYGSSLAGDMGQEAIEAAQSTLTQVQAGWPGDTYANIGVTPMTGQNDDSAEVFSEADAETR